MKRLLNYFLAIGHTDVKERIVGYYATGKGEAIIRIYQLGDLFFGNVEKVKPIPGCKTDVRDQENKNLHKQFSLIKGMQVIKNLVLENGRFISHHAYDPRTGERCQCEIEVHRNKLCVQLQYASYHEKEIWRRISMD